MAVSSQELRRFGRRAIPFAAIGLLIYGGLYVVAERLVVRYGERNRFFVVHQAPPGAYDHVILGSSHAAVFDYRDMNRRLESMTGARIMNLAVPGAGVVVNRVLLDYFLTRHQTRSLVYVLDSFAVHSRVWNEDRLGDADLLARAPFDLALLRVLFADPATWEAALDYLTGFSKINNPDRFVRDRFEDEGPRFERVYRPVPQIDRQRVAFLYPDGVTEQALDDNRYVAELERLMQGARHRGLRVILLRPPLPLRFSALLPHETRFEQVMAAMAARLGAEYHDFSAVNNDDTLFFDPDHLNREGVLLFFERHLAPLLEADVGADRDPPVREPVDSHHDAERMDSSAPDGTFAARLGSSPSSPPWSRLELRTCGPRAPSGPSQR